MAAFLFNKCKNKDNESFKRVERHYLSWKVMICLLWEIIIIRRQMWHHIVFMCHSKCIWNNFTITRCKSSITNSWHSKCHNLNVFCTIYELLNHSQKTKLKFSYLNTKTTQKIKHVF